VTATTPPSKVLRSISDGIGIGGILSVNDCVHPNIIPA
jgi:hypothetical protein